MRTNRQSCTVMQVGGVQPALRKPLDEEPEEVLSYKALAKQCTSNAQAAVDK